MVSGLIVRRLVFRFGFHGRHCKFFILVSTIRSPEKSRDELTNNFYCGWNNQEEHITRFTQRHDDKHTKLQLDRLVISDVDKLQHYMLQMWDCLLFDQLPMTEWTIKPNKNKSYENAVTFFNEKVNPTSKMPWTVATTTN